MPSTGTINLLNPFQKYQPAINMGHFPGRSVKIPAMDTSIVQYLHTVWVAIELVDEQLTGQGSCLSGQRQIQIGHSITPLGTGRC